MPRAALLAAFLVFVGAPSAGAVAVIPDPFPTPAQITDIAGLVNQYLQAAQGASTAGGWLDASPSGDTPNRGQSLLLPSTVVPSGPDLTGPQGPNPPGTPPAGQVIIGFSSSAISGIVFFNDGSGNSSTLSAALAQFVAGYGNSDGSTTSFYTFCIDLAHTVTNDQTYSATPRSDVKTAFTNGAEMAYIMSNFGSADLSSNPEQAAAVQIALWDLSLSNHTPTMFGADGDGTYSSGDKTVFNISFAKVPEPSSATLLLAGLTLLGVVAVRRSGSLTWRR